MRYLPARDRYKIFIIDEAHMLTTEAFNALLKTLEEPPPRSLFILATTEAHKLPSTIQSRCQHFSFRLLDYQEIFSRLAWVAEQEQIQAEEGALSAVTQAAEGSMRDGLSLLDQVIASCGSRLEETRVRQVLGVVPTQLLNGVLEAVHAGDARRVLELVGQLAAEGYELAHFCGELTRTVRNLMVAKSCGAESPLVQVATEDRARLAELAGLFGEEDLARFFNLLLRTESEMRYALQPRFHLELGLMKLVHARRLAPLEALLGQLGEPGALAKAAAAAPRSPATAPVRPAPLQTAPASPALPMRVGAGASPAPRGPSTETRPVARVAPPAGGGQVDQSVTKSESVSAAVPAEAAEGDPRLSSIKALLFEQSKRFLSSCLDHLTGFRVENGEVCFTFTQKDSLYADLLKGREQQEALRAASTQVLGQPVKIYVTLGEQGEAQASGASARERAERDPAVDAFKKKLEGALLEVRDLRQE